MPPSDLQASAFALYPPRAREIAVMHLPLLRRLPTNFLAVMLRELIGYDWHFPAERAEMDTQLRMLGAMSAAELDGAMAGFRALPITAELEQSGWASEPAAFVEKMTAYLWTVHAMDAFRAAALAYGERLDAAQAVAEGMQPPRWCVVVVGRGANGSSPALFQKLRPLGTRFTQVSAEGGLQAVLAAAAARARSAPAAYGHWYVDGGAAAGRPGDAAGGGGLVTVSYQALAPVRSALLERMHHARVSGTVGPEDLRSLLAAMRPEDLGETASAGDEVRRRFELALLTEGSGTQIFSTTFVQWAGREVLRRARPQTLVLRYAPRQVDRPMNDLLLVAATSPKEDAEGSLVDADMGAYYTWLNLRRLRGAESARFVAWRESGREAVVIAPGMPRGATSAQACDVEKILGWIA